MDKKAERTPFGQSNKLQYLQTKEECGIYIFYVSFMSVVTHVISIIWKKPLGR